MAKANLTWKTVDVANSGKPIAAAWKGEQEAIQRTTIAVQDAASKAEKCQPHQIRVGRGFGKLSYAVDLAAKPGGASGETVALAAG